MNDRFTALLRQRTLWLLFVLLVWISAFGRGFWSLANLQNLVVAVSVEGVMVMGMTIVMIGGGFDLSIGSVVALSGRRNLVRPNSRVSGGPYQRHVDHSSSR